MILAHWTYTKNEWRAFISRTKKQKGFFNYIIHLSSAIINQKVPEIKITSERVYIGDDHQHFSGQRHQLMQINIREEGIVNILEIMYENICVNENSVGEITIPVPKGKLREAFEVEEKLISKKM